MAHMDLTETVLSTGALTAAQTEQVLALFDANYEQADHDYLLKSFKTLQWIALASHAGTIVGFALGDSRRVHLPRMTEKQAVGLAGIACISPDFRRQGLFTRLASASMMAPGVIRPDQPFLFCGRMAHAITYRTLAHATTNIVPSADRSITEWHREVLECVASLFGVTLAPGSSVVVGTGSPIGYPRIAYEATDAEKTLFKSVNRKNGDSLLAISWIPTAPDGW